MLVLIISAIVGFSIGRVISLVASQLFKQRFSLNVTTARTLIVLGSGGKQKHNQSFIAIFKFVIVTRRTHDRNAGDC